MGRMGRIAAELRAGRAGGWRKLDGITGLTGFLCDGRVAWRRLKLSLFIWLAAVPFLLPAHPSKSVFC